MKKMFLFAGICTILCCSCFAFANSEGLSKDSQYVLDLILGNRSNVKEYGKSFVDEESGITYSEVVSSESLEDLFENLNSKDKADVLNWIKTNHEQVKPAYFMYFADYMFDKDKEEGTFWYLVGMLRVMEDTQMCKDTSNQQQVYIYTMMAPKTAQHLVNKGSKYRYEMTKKIVEWDKTHTNRVNPIWACYHGISNFTRAGEPEMLPMSEYPKIQNELQKMVIDSFKR